MSFKDKLKIVVYICTGKGTPPSSAWENTVFIFKVHKVLRIALLIAILGSIIKGIYSLYVEKNIAKAMVSFVLVSIAILVLVREMRTPIVDLRFKDEDD